VEEHEFEARIERHEECGHCRGLLAQLAREMEDGYWNNAGDTCRDIESHIHSEEEAGEES
jgi:hypothetical protein